MTIEPSTADLGASPETVQEWVAHLLEEIGQFDNANAILGNRAETYRDDLVQMTLRAEIALAIVIYLFLTL